MHPDSRFCCFGGYLYLLCYSSRSANKAVLRGISRRQIVCTNGGPSALLIKNVMGILTYAAYNLIIWCILLMKAKNYDPEKSS